MPNKIQLKRSTTASAAPTAGQLDAGELAINTADGRLFAKNSAGTVVNLPVTSISGQTITPNTVGVGTTSPSVPLHVVSTGDGVEEIARFRRQNSGNTDGAQLSIHADNTNDLVQIRSTGTSAGALAFYSGSNERIRMTTAGNVGIGTSTPSYKLDVVGDVNIQGNLTVSGSAPGGGGGGADANTIFHPFLLGGM